MEANLNLSEQRFNAFLKNNTEAIWCFEIEQPVDISLPVDKQIDLLYKYACLLEANDAMARMYGYENGEEMVGFRLEDFLPRSNPESIAFLKKHIRDTYNSVDEETVEFTREGEKRYFLNNTTGIIEDGHLVRTWGTHRDISKQKVLEEELTRNQNDLQIFDIDINYIHLGGTYDTKYENIHPYVAGGLGLAHMSPDGGDAETKFSFSLAGGTKWFFAEHIGIRLEGRGFGTFMGGSNKVFCRDDNFSVITGGDLFWQFAIYSGLIIEFKTE